MTKFFKFVLFCSCIISILACGPRKLPDRSVKIYKDQLSLVDGSYLINAYESPSFPDNLKGIDHFFDIKIPFSVSYVNLKFVDEETLQLSFDTDGMDFKKTFKGKLKNGAFYFTSERSFFGIPLTAYTKVNRFERLMMGSDDNLILERFDEKVNRVFNSVEESYFWESYLYDRLYKGIHIDLNGKLIE